MMLSEKTCGGHKTNLIENSSADGMSDAIGSRVFGVLYSTCLLFRMGGYFLRLIHAVDKAVEKHAVMKFGKPPPRAEQYRNEVREFLVQAERHRCKVFLVNFSS